MPQERHPSMASRPTRADGASPASGHRAGTAPATKACRRCGSAFVPTPRSRQVYCSERCRGVHNVQMSRERKREREAAEANAETAAFMERAAEGGFPSTLRWRNSDGQAKEDG